MILHLFYWHCYFFTFLCIFVAQYRPLSWANKYYILMYLLIAHHFGMYSTRRDEWSWFLCCIIDGGPSQNNFASLGDERPIRPTRQGQTVKVSASLPSAVYGSAVKSEIASSSNYESEYVSVLSVSLSVCLTVSLSLCHPCLLSLSCVSVSICVCVTICVCVYPPAYLLVSLCLSVCVSVCLSVCVILINQSSFNVDKCGMWLTYHKLNSNWICLTVCLYVCVFVYMSVCLCVYLPACLYVCMSVYCISQPWASSCPIIWYASKQVVLHWLAFEVVGVNALCLIYAGLQSPDLSHLRAYDRKLIND